MRAKAATEAQREEWTKLIGLLLTLAEFVDERIALDPKFPAVDAHSGRSLKYRDHLEPLREPVPPYAVRLPGMRQALSDLLTMVSYMGGQERRAVDAVLRSKHGVSLDELQSAQLQKLRTIVAKGRLATDVQFRLVFERYDFIAEEPEHVEEARVLKSLLEEYEARKMSRKR